MKNILFLLALCSSAAAADKGCGGNGRFQLVQVGSLRMDQYLLDTCTGQFWRMSCGKFRGKECNLTIWEKEYVMGRDLSYEQLEKLKKAPTKADDAGE
jgi:opacity protein-like surface antigen